MKYLVLITAFFLVSFSPKCPSKYGVKNSWIYSRISFAGIVAVDENGKQLTKGSWHTHFLYLEVDEQNIARWDSAFYNNKMYQLSFFQIKSNNVEVGKINEEGKTIVLKPKSNHTLILINFRDMDIPMESSEQKIILFGSKKNKKIQLEISKKNINLLPELRP